MKGDADIPKFVDQAASKMKAGLDIVVSHQMRVSEVVTQQA
jgi:hypothetical protein